MVVQNLLSTNSISEIIVVVKAADDLHTLAFNFLQLLQATFARRDLVKG